MKKEVKVKKEMIRNLNRMNTTLKMERTTVVVTMMMMKEVAMVQIEVN
jgi:hypothetical protein